MFDFHISGDATVTGWRLLGEIEVFVTALVGSRLPAAMVTVSYGNRKQRSLAFSVKLVPFHMSVALRQNFHLCFSLALPVVGKCLETNWRLPWKLWVTKTTCYQPEWSQGGSWCLCSWFNLATTSHMLPTTWGVHSAHALQMTFNCVVFL